jgi:DNA-binding NarL/FixJ family response regulator
VLCPAVLLKAHLEALIGTDPGLRVWHPEEEGQPDVVLCVAESGAGLRTLRSSPLPCPWPKAVLYDLAGALGALGAGLHGFQGYCPHDVNAERLLRCLRRVAAGWRDALRPHYEILLRVLDEPPLDNRDRKILSLLALGSSNTRIEREVPIDDRTLRRSFGRLDSLFDVDDRCHLAAAAVALNLGWPWKTESPEGRPVAIAGGRRVGDRRAR